METDRILRLPEVLHTTGYSRSSLYRAIRARRFPPPVGVGDRARGWRDSEIQAWIRDLETVEIGPGAGEGGDLPQEPHG
jgi:prophage regulatory protein